MPGEPWKAAFGLDRAWGVPGESWKAAFGARPDAGDAGRAAESSVREWGVDGGGGTALPRSRVCADVPLIWWHRSAVPPRSRACGGAVRVEGWSRSGCRASHMVAAVPAKSPPETSRRPAAAYEMRA